ncbi:MAG: cyclopropane-fatty-acyl-phospholipid synthase family protein [Thiobacillaceae bacterium]
MLDGLLIRQVHNRLGSSGLPLALTLWNGQELASAIPAKVRLTLHSPRVLKVLARPTLGDLARAYVEGELGIEGDARDILRLGENLCNDCSGTSVRGTEAWKWWRHTRTRDRKNIQYHYDVSNDFYALWLDRNRVYSCAYFKTPELSLDAAQEAKLDLICRKLDLKPGEQFLDIGCGWGGLILWAAEHYGVRARGITLSDNQRDYVNEQIAARGMADRVDVRHMDYRDVGEEGQYDKVASVGMFEHVGRRNLPDYFAKIFRLLKPGGLVMNHGITAQLPHTKGLGNGIAEFAEEYVFPGGELVHISEVMAAATRAGLECLDGENLRPHYGRTLWHWVTRLESRADEAKHMIGERKYRIWRIYMAGAAHAFDQGWMELWQVLAGKPAAAGLQPAYSFNRENFYREHTRSS